MRLTLFFILFWGNFSAIFGCSSSILKLHDQLHELGNPSYQKDDNDTKFSFNGTLQKTMDVYEYPSSIKVRWFNFMEGDDSRPPWVHCDGTSSVFPELDTKFGFAMETNMDEFDESITTDPKVIPWLAKYYSIPEEEIANIKFAMGFVTGQYKNDIECVFGNDLGFRSDNGTNGEVAFADRYAVFYKNGDLHCGADNRDRPNGGKSCSSESWWYKIPQGFSCGVGVAVPDDFFDGFVPVDCSEIVVKVAQPKSCRNNPDLGDDCFNYVNWT